MSEFVAKSMLMSTKVALAAIGGAEKVAAFVGAIPAPLATAINNASGSLEILACSLESHLSDQDD